MHNVVYFDFNKAFDSVPHNEFLLLGITGPLWMWYILQTNNSLFPLVEPLHPYYQSIQVYPRAVYWARYFF